MLAVALLAIVMVASTAPSQAASIVDLRVTAQPGVTPTGSLTLTVRPGVTGLAGATILDAIGTSSRYIAVGQTTIPAFSGRLRGAIWTSRNGVAWTLHRPPSDSGAVLTAIARGTSGRLVAVGGISSRGVTTAAIWTSTNDGSTWRRVIGLPTDGIPGGFLADVTAFGRGFVAVGDLEGKANRAHAFALHSSDGVHWTRATFVDGASGKLFSGVLATTSGLIGYGVLTDGNQAPDLLGAEVWHSAHGIHWKLDAEAPGFRNPDTGGGSSRQMEVVWRDGSRLLGVVTPAEDGSPLVYASSNGVSWTQLAVSPALEAFVPRSVISLAGGGQLLAGTDILSTSPGAAIRGAVAWEHTAVDTWLQVDVAQPATPGDTIAINLNALVKGPAGTLALGGVSHLTAPFSTRGAVWMVAP